jgi:hypothetical protein
MRAVPCVIVLLAAPASVAAQWPGFADVSAEVDTARYDFSTAGGSNENYYDGDFGDYDGDGRIDRAVISRYGLLWNAGDGVMIPVSTQRRNDIRPNSTPSLTGYLFGDEVSIGNDAVQWVDLDGDGDLDVVQGGNGEPLVVQQNRGGRFAEWARLSGSAVQIVTTDLERDGDADLVVACWFASGPDDFSLFVNDGRGNLTESAATRGVAYAGQQIIGVASGDVDRDGDFDLVLLSRAANELWVLSNDGTGNFSRRTTAVPGTIRGTSGFSQGLNLGDVDGDGDLDVVIATDDYIGSHPRVGHLVFVNDGSGGMTEQSATRFVVDDSFTFVGKLIGGNGKLLDVDYDGDLDFIAFTDLAGPPLNLQLFLNDGAGQLVYTRAGIPTFGAAETMSVGADLDVADLNHDGTYDLWVGVGGARVVQLRNLHRDPSGARADQPRRVEVVEQTAEGIRLRWDPPPFAATARHYIVLRSLSPGRERRDRPVLRTVAISELEDEGFAAPIGPMTRTDEIDDPDVRIDGGSIELLDRTAVPGVTYHYSVVHVGPENAHGTPSAEVVAMVPATGGPDTVPPEISIVSPTVDNWSASPRIVVAFADGGSGLDDASLSITLNRDAGVIAPDTNLVDSAVVRGRNIAVIALDEALPVGAVELTVRVTDLEGNEAVESIRFAVTVDPGAPPSVTAGASPESGEAPLTVRFTGDGSAGDGEILRWEWFFGDGTTATGRVVDHSYASEGTYAVVLRAIDDSGAAALATTTMSVGPCTGACIPPDAGPGADDGGAAGGDGAAPPPDDRVPARSSEGCACDAAATSRSPAWVMALPALLFAWRQTWRRRRR